MRRYAGAHGGACIRLKAVLFDMDGVMYNSMPYHTAAWHTVMERHGLHLSRGEAYLHEGRTGAATINIVYRRQNGKDAPQELIESIYAEKCGIFSSFPEPDAMPGAWELLQQLRAEGIVPVLVTGSGQKTMLKRILADYPGMFDSAHMVTAFDVKYGKPHPEPYLMGLVKAGGLQPNEAVVVENAPIGVEAGVAAGVFTIAVNTGPLEARVLREAGADYVLPSMPALCEAWKSLRQTMEEERCAR
ncbi:MAG: HAD-IA family hydrolase [Prevotellaceae bacterium]|nr:HAD-IA family hydrolase [Prevotellaceae bacterium]